MSDYSGGPFKVHENNDNHASRERRRRNPGNVKRVNGEARRRAMSCHPAGSRNHDAVHHTAYWFDGRHVYMEMPMMCGEAVMGAMETVTLEDARPGDVARAISGNHYRLVAVLPEAGRTCRPRYVVDADGELLRLDEGHIGDIGRWSDPRPDGTASCGTGGLEDISLLRVQTSSTAARKLS